MNTSRIKGTIIKSIAPAALFFGLVCCNKAIPSATKPEKKETKNVQEEKCISLKEVKFASGVAMNDGSPLSGKICSYHANGNVHTMTSYKNGTKEGLWEVFFADGQKEKSGFTRQGSDDGLYREWFTNGQLKYEYHYDLGQKVDVWKSWYEDGTRYTERHFEDDQLNGKVLVWDENGKLAKEYDYVRGQLVNSQMHFKEGN